MERSKRRKDEDLSKERRMSKKGQRLWLAGCLVTEERRAAGASACAPATPESEPRGPSAVGSAERGATGSRARVPAALGAQVAFCSPVTSRDASMVARARLGGSESGGYSLRRTSCQERAAATAPWSAVGAENHEPRGRGLLQRAAADGRLAAPGGPPVRVWDERHRRPGSRLGP